MPRPLGDATGERLELTTYYVDFVERYERASEFWKLEVGQVFAEPNDESWSAFDRGEWEESLRSLEEQRPELMGQYRECAARGLTNWRVRIVRLPPTNYLQWELRVLMIREELGERTRVLRGEQIAEFEDQGPLPDLGVIGTDAVYQIMYDDIRAADHVIRYTNEALVRRCRDFVAGLYERGEPIAEFFEREIAPLPPPRPARPSIPHDYWERTGRPRSPRM